MIPAFLSDHAFLRLAWSNFAEVIPGKLYRSNHPTVARLERWARGHGLRTVVNLRGPNPMGAITEAASGQLGLKHVFMAFESRGAPHRDRILRFHDIYTTMEFPALIHCKSGADRAGLAAGLAILFEGGTSADALRQLSWRYLHVKQSKTGILDAFFLRFAAQAEGRKPFLKWVRDDYREEDLRQAFRAGGLASFVNDRLLHRE